MDVIYCVIYNPFKIFFSWSYALLAVRIQFLKTFLEVFRRDGVPCYQRFFNLKRTYLRLLKVRNPYLKRHSLKTPLLDLFAHCRPAATCAPFLPAVSPIWYFYVVIKTAFLLLTNAIDNCLLTRMDPILALGSRL